MNRYEYAFPCGGCLCNSCSNNVENIKAMGKEMKKPCFQCDYCCCYDMKNTEDGYQEECDEYRITEYHSQLRRKQLRLVKG